MRGNYRGNNPFSKEKLTLTDTVFHVEQNEPFTWKQLKDFVFQDDDEIHIYFEPAYYGSDSAYDAHYVVEIYRDRLETDKEFDKRIAKQKIESEQLKAKRKEKYLKLKEEFEGKE